MAVWKTHGLFLKMLGSNGKYIFVLSVLNCVKPPVGPLRRWGEKSHGQTGTEREKGRDHRRTEERATDPQGSHAEGSLAPTANGSHLSYFHCGWV